MLLTARDQLRLATAEESAAAATIGEDALLSKQTVHEDEDKRAIDVSEHQPLPEPPERPEAAGVREAVYRGRQAIKDKEIQQAKQGTIRDRPMVKFHLPPVSFRE